MVTHIVGWRLHETLAEPERAAAKQKIKTELEALVGVVPGLLAAQVLTQPLPGVPFDVALLATLQSAAALAGYQKHPAHLAAAAFVRSMNGHRVALDFEA